MKNSKCCREYPRFSSQCKSDGMYECLPLSTMIVTQAAQKIPANREDNHRKRAHRSNSISTKRTSTRANNVNEGVFATNATIKNIPKFNLQIFV